MKIQVLGGKVCLRCKGKTLLDDVNKLFVLKVCWHRPAMFCLITSNKTFPRKIWIFAEGEGDGIESRLSAIFLNLFYFSNCPKQERKLSVEQLHSMGNLHCYFEGEKYKIEITFWILVTFIVLQWFGHPEQCIPDSYGIPKRSTKFPLKIMKN